MRDHYRVRFPELESLVHHPVDYARVVAAIGNESDITNVDLDGVLPSATIMVVSVTASTTAGQPLPELELQQVIWRLQNPEPHKETAKGESARENLVPSATSPTSPMWTGTAFCLPPQCGDLRHGVDDSRAAAARIGPPTGKPQVGDSQTLCQQPGKLL